MSARWYKRCGADFIHGTMMLTLEEKGAYSLCLDLIYDRGGPIPDDARWLSGVCGVSMRKWTALRDRLLSLGKLVAEDGQLSNVRAALELVSAELSSRERAETGAKGGRKRAENAAKANEINDLAQAELKPKEKIREDEKEERDKPSPTREALPDWVPAEPWADWVDMRRRIRKPLTPRAEKLALTELKKLADAGWPPGAVLNNSTLNSYPGLYPPKDRSNGRSDTLGRHQPSDGLSATARAGLDVFGASPAGH